MKERFPGHPDLSALQAPKCPAVQAGVIVRPHHPPGEQIFPKLTEAAEGAIIWDDGKPQVLHHVHTTGVIGKRKQNRNAIHALNLSVASIFLHQVSDAVERIDKATPQAQRPLEVGAGGGYLGHPFVPNVQSQDRLTPRYYLVTHSHGMRSRIELEAQEYLGVLTELKQPALEAQQVVDSADCNLHLSSNHKLRHQVLIGFNNSMIELWHYFVHLSRI